MACPTLYKKALALICSKKRAWTKEEDEVLSLFLKQNIPVDSLLTSLRLFPFSRSAGDCWLRGQELHPEHKTKNQLPPPNQSLSSILNPMNRWTIHNNQTLLDRIREVGLASWERVAEVFGNRFSSQDCEERFVFLVNSAHVKTQTRSTKYKTGLLDELVDDPENCDWDLAERVLNHPKLTLKRVYKQKLKSPGL
ncbi:MAG: hypothetical protein LLG04_13520 [Parachlamydia sp.]|nr:hypothetical protein [Parachlamydia sp.]